MRSELIEKLSLLSTGAFGLVAALAWNDAIQAIFKSIFGERSSIAAMLSYAIVVTIAAVLITLWISRAAEKAKTTDFRALLRRKKQEVEIAKVEQKIAKIEDKK